MASWVLATPTSPPFAYSSLWHSCCMSSDGQTAFIGENRIWRTKDAGLTWIELTPTGVSEDRGWQGLSCSADAQTVMASDVSPGRLWLSFDGGDTWTETRPNGDNDLAWGPNAMSTTGGVLYASQANASAPTNHIRLYKSTNAGTSWTDVAAAATWTYSVGPATRLSGCRCSDDGLSVLCCEPVSGINGGRLRVTNDGGTTWTELQPEGNFAIDWGTGSDGVLIAMDSTGQKLLAASKPFSGHGGRMHYSTNQGSTWTELTPFGATNIQWWGVAMSKDTSWILATNKTNFLFYGSRDNGSTWTDQEMLFPNPLSADSNGTIAINTDATFAMTDGDTGDPDYFDAVLYYRTTVTPPPPFERNTLIYARDQMADRSGWILDTYTPGVLIHYGEEGSNQHSILCGGDDGGIYQLTGDSDNGDDVFCHITTASKDQGDTRLNKLYGDIMLDCETGSVDVSATSMFNNDSIVSAIVTVNNATRTQVPLPVGTEWQTARNISLDLTWAMNGSRQYFYIWEPRFTEEGGKIFAYSWETSYLSHDLPGYFYHGYFYMVHISTADLTFTIYGEDGLVKASVLIPNSGGVHNKTFVRLPVVKGKWFKYKLTSTAEFRVEGQESELLVKPWGMGGPWKRVKVFQDVPHGEAA